MAINMPAIADPMKSEPYEREKKKVEEKKEKEEKLYKRSSFRKSTRKIAEKNAPRNSNGEMICPTCGKVIPEKIQVQTKNGIKTRVGYDLDHYPTTWAERAENMKSSGMKYTIPEKMFLIVIIQMLDVNVLSAIKSIFLKK